MDIVFDDVMDCLHKTVQVLPDVMIASGSGRLADTAPSLYIAVIHDQVTTVLLRNILPKETRASK